MPNLRYGYQYRDTERVMLGSLRGTKWIYLEQMIDSGTH